MSATTILLVKISLVLAVIAGLALLAETQGILVPKIGDIQTQVTCQGKRARIRCNNDSLVIVIYTASYGRQEKGQIICPYDEDLKTVEGVNGDTRDDYWGSCKMVDVTKQLSEACHKKKKCGINVGQEKLGQPCKGIYKYLKVIYACGFPIYVPFNITGNQTSWNWTGPLTGRNPVTLTPAPQSNASTTEPFNVKLTNIMPSSRVTSVTINTTENTLSAVMSSTENENSSTYVAVFVVSALCAALIMGAIFGRWIYLKRRTKSQKFAVLHKPKRFLKTPSTDGKPGQNGHSRGRPLDMNMNGGEGSGLRTGDLVVTTADVDGGLNKHVNIENYGDNEEQQVPKGDNSSFYVNPMYDQNRPNGGAVCSRVEQPGNQRHDTHRLSNASDGRAGVYGSPVKTPTSPSAKQRQRCNSVGNIARGGHHHHGNMQRRHPSVGNVSSNRNADHVANSSAPRGGSQHQNLLYNAPQIQPYQGHPQGYPPQGDGKAGVTYPQQVPSGGTHPLAMPQQGPSLRGCMQRPSVGSIGAPGNPQGKLPMPGMRPPSPYEYGNTEKNLAPQQNNSRAQSLPRLNVGVAQSRMAGQQQHDGSPSSGYPPTPGGSRHWHGGAPVSTDPKNTGKSQTTPQENRKTPDSGDLVSPLDAPGRNTVLRSSLRKNSYSSREGPPQVHSSAPPDQGSDSSEDDLYSIVAKGTYDACVPDPNCPKSALASKDGHRRTGSDGSRKQTKFAGRDTAV
ncbi:uncharacterized protein LOC5513784 isoform X5 [Nematostella vectensis]|uniref:uncharacterized protein LOC5513784 isoform X5 n=1 Tax=Nematostella vectensis TaxID=45351 RepID=UPI00207786F2|nr:uncharacterized protein LOC5513784 isoform X5 [Nematostella vectensis]